MDRRLLAALIASAGASAPPAAGQCEVAPLPTYSAGAFSQGTAIVTASPAFAAGVAASFYERGASGWTAVDRFHVGDIHVFFRYPASIDGDHAIVGGPEAVFDLSGRAYVFERTGTTWTQTELAASNQGACQWFGSAVDISGDVAVVGASHAGGVQGDYQSQAYVFERTAGGWVEVLALPVVGYGFGAAVAVDGDTVAVGAIYESAGSISQAGAVYVYEKVGGAWTETLHRSSSLPQVHQFFGAALDLLGDTLVVGAPIRQYPDPGVAGFVDVFRRSPAGAWTSAGRLAAGDAAGSDEFGATVALSGTTLLVGAPDAEVGGEERGAVHRFERSGPTWIETDRIHGQVPYGRFGEALGFEGNDAYLSGSSDAGFYSLGIARSASYCTATQNSTGHPGGLAAEGCDSLAGNALTLVAHSLPPGETGFVLFGQAAAQVPFGAGFLCLGAPAHRLPARAVDAAGELREELDFDAPPAAVITAGTTWRFQVLYEDSAAGGSGVNGTDGLALLVEP